jgi:superfamily II DNA or RNA helicase
VVIIDEAHTQYKTTREYLERTRAAVVGLTATPCSSGLGLSYSNLINAATMAQLTDLGILVPMRILSCTKPDMEGAATSGGEWTDRAAAEREAQIIGDVVAEWQRYGEDRKTIAFGADIAYCTSLAQRFNQAGITAYTYTSETSDSEREYLLKEFSKPDSQIRVLISVEALAKGFDVQDIGAVIDARPLRKSLSTAIQMWGRGLRSAPDKGKSDCLLLDHSGNIQRFLSDFEQVYHHGFTALDMAEKLDKEVRKEPEDFKPCGCPSCGRTPFHRRCMACGFEKVSLALEDATSGVMREIRIGKSVIATDKFNLWQQLCAYTRGGGKPETANARAYYLFRDITGDKPPRNWDFATTPPADITRGTMNKIKSLRIAYIKGKQKAAA